MPRQPLLTAATLTLLTLTACTHSPEAGQPNTTPTTPTTTSNPTPTPSSPTWTTEQQTAITAAKARYTVARAAVNAAFKQPAKATTSALETAGNGGSWMTAVAGQLDFQIEHGWYQTGDATVTSLEVRSVNLDLEQPEVKLTSCIDSSRVVSRYLSSGKPVPVASDNGSHHRFESRLVYAKSAKTGQKMWFLVDEKTTKPC
ncbi:hypothetical protein GCM10009804_39560 [Kribbella hippodromi]|uniref:Lipoprotein n=1 Tax=Kribbella hippodromi TaxID=434347 RepID=A0ABN2DMX3_9ACTN